MNSGGIYVCLIKNKDGVLRFMLLNCPSEVLVLNSAGQIPITFGDHYLEVCFTAIVVHDRSTRLIQISVTCHSQYYLPSAA